MTSHSDGTRTLAAAVPAAPGADFDGLAIGGLRLAEYHRGADLPADHSPRPYLHPLRSLAGVELTEVAPTDHPHHYGVSMAVADVDGTSHWGGRTFVTGTGSTMLANHGRQESLGRTGTTRPDGQSIEESLLWRDRNGDAQLSETRTIQAGPLPDGTGWVLGWTSVLTASHGPVRIASPAVNGRPGAGYGGIFWRLPNRAETTVLSAGGPGEAVAHGSASPWLALNQVDGDRRVGLLLTQPASLARPWFVRATEYSGAGPMLAAESALTIEPGASVSTSLVGVVLDRWVADAADAEGILRAAGLAVRA